MGQAAHTNRPAIFKCWNGLYDCAIPIAPKGEVLGYFLCGQILTEAPHLERFAGTAEEIGAPPAAYVETVRDVRVMALDQYESSIRTMHTLAQMIADQAAAAIDNLKMLQDAVAAKEDAAKLVEELEVILEAFRDSFAQTDDRSTLETIADQLQRLIPYDSCLIYTVDDGADELFPRVVRDPNPEAFKSHRPRKGIGVWGKVAATGVRRKIDDVREDPEFVPVPGVDLEPEAMLVVPMIRKAQIFGVISLSRFERRVFTEHELRDAGRVLLARLAVDAGRPHAPAEHAEAAGGAGAGRAAQHDGARPERRGDARGDRAVRPRPARRTRGAAPLRPRSPALRAAWSRWRWTTGDADELLGEIELEIEGCMARRRLARARPHRRIGRCSAPLSGRAEVARASPCSWRPAGQQWDQNARRHLRPPVFARPAQRAGA